MIQKSFFYSLFIVPYYFFYSSALAQELQLTKKDTSEVRFINQRKFFIYKVEKEETLYSISKKFKITQGEIEEFNLELKEGLKARMKLWIPAISLLKKEETVAEPKEKHHHDDVYHIAIMTALNIPEHVTKDSSLVDSVFVNSNLSVETLSNLEFYEGIMMAIDSLKKSKPKVHLHLFDTENDSLKTSILLKNPEMKKMDLIISNGSNATIKPINAYSKTNHISFASFTMNAGELIKDNKDAIVLTPSSLTQCQEMGKIAAEKFGQSNCIVLKTLAGKENERSMAFKKGWSGSSDKKIFEVDFSAIIKKTMTDSMTDYLKAIKSSLQLKEDNLVFVPSSSEEFVSTLINAMKEYSEQYRITLIGLPTWQHFETIDPLLFELLNVHIFTSSFINYNSTSSVAFRKKFYSIYTIEPTEGAFQGFDLMMLLGSELIKSGKNFRDHLTENCFKGLFSSYTFGKSSDYSFLENHYIAVCNYRNYELKKIND